jgi:hypothetical protein
MLGQKVTNLFLWARYRYNTIKFIITFVNPIEVPLDLFLNLFDIHTSIKSLFYIKIPLASYTHLVFRSEF